MCLSKLEVVNDFHFWIASGLPLILRKNLLLPNSIKKTKLSQIEILNAIATHLSEGFFTPNIPGK